MSERKWNVRSRDGEQDSPCAIGKNSWAGLVALMVDHALGMPRAHQTSSAGDLGFGSSPPIPFLR